MRRVTDGDRLRPCNLLDRLCYGPVSTPGTLTLSGLTEGNTYRLQILKYNALNPTGENVGFTILGIPARTVNVNPGTKALNLIAEFTANSDSVVLRIDNDYANQVFNAYALHALPPAGTLISIR